MYKLKIRNKNDILIRVKTFNTKQELEEFYHEFKNDDRLLIRNEWFKIIDKKEIRKANEKEKLVFVKDEIINISKPLSFPISEDFWVIDFEMVKDVLYMGTSEGLLKYTENLVERVDLGELRYYPSCNGC